MSQSKSSFWLSAAAFVTVAAGAWFYHGSNKSVERGSKSRGMAALKGASDIDSLITERFNSCVHHMKEQISKLPHSSQLEFYGLYKQAILGNADDFIAHPPPAYDLVASAKYKAWKAREGMPRSAAMQEYIDKAVHFEFTRSMLSNDDEDFEMEGDPVLDMNGMGIQQSTLAARTREEETADAEADRKFPLHAAARENQLATLEGLLSGKGGKKRDPNELDLSGQSALHLAADAGNPECIKILVKHGADVHAVDNDGISVLQAAVISGDVETCRLLCMLGANPDQPDEDGDTPRECAKDDPVLRDLLFRASMGQLEIDADFQRELQELGTAPEKSKDDDLVAFDNIPIDLDDGDGDM